MLDHHIQREIVYALAFSEGMRFGELKPDDLENKAFDYHLKKVVKAGYVVKHEDGTYGLTSEGKRVGKGALKKQNRLIDRAYSTLLLAIRRSDGAWLLYRRRTHPMIGLSGFMHAQPVADKDVVQTAADVCREQTGLSGEFIVHGHGYFRVYHDDLLESFTHFTLLTCTDIQGELIQNSELAEYYWDTDPDFSAPDMLPNMQTLRKMFEAPVGQFVEQTFDI
jgi:DNA-binding transcriptional ArsR family regulator